MLFVFFIAWVVIGFLISYKTPSKTLIVGGGFIGACIALIFVAQITDQPKPKSTIAKIEKQKRIKKQKQVERQQKKAVDLQECKKTIECWGKNFATIATYKCKDVIETRSHYAYKWTDSFFGSKLKQFRWGNKQKYTITYIGDTIQFQNKYGAWENKIYFCEYDPFTESVVSVKMRNGRLPK